MVLKFVVLFSIVTILYMSEVFFEKIFLTRPWKALFVTTDDSISEWWFRWKIDRYVSQLYMCDIHTHPSTKQQLCIWYLFPECPIRNGVCLRVRNSEVTPPFRWIESRNPASNSNFHYVITCFARWYTCEYCLLYIHWRWVQLCNEQRYFKLERFYHVNILLGNKNKQL